MTKQAHITSRPEYEVGDKVLAICGKKFRVTELWADVPLDKPICRPCVDRLLVAATEADSVIEAARLGAMLSLAQVRRIENVLDPDGGLTFDEIAARDREYQQEREEKARAKEAQALAQQRCLCTWSAEDIRDLNPDCPIHGHGPDDPVEG